MTIPQFQMPFDRKRTFLLVSMSVGFIVLYSGTIIRLARFSLSSDAFSYMVLIPFVSAFFLFKERKMIFENIRYSLPAGSIILASGLLVLGASRVWNGLISEDYVLHVQRVHLLSR